MIKPIIEIDEEVYRYEPSQNGSGPMWTHGNTCLVRIGEDVYSSGVETIPGEVPLNNVRWQLFQRTAHGWQRVARDTRRTREPSPLACFPGQRQIFLSANPTLAPSGTAGGAAALPEVLRFSASDPAASPLALSPGWAGKPQFSEHSYRSFAADGPNRELILFNQVAHPLEYSHAEWAFRNADGNWSAQGQLKFPWGAEYDRPQPIRICYPTIALRNRRVYLCGVSDIPEPYESWRRYKDQLSAAQPGVPKGWDFDFRRLFYTWSDDIAVGHFHPWVEIASRDKTCGYVFPLDMYVADDGVVHILWTERAIDVRLRDKFYPGEKQSFSLNYAVIRDGVIQAQEVVQILREDLDAEVMKDHAFGSLFGEARFQITPHGRLFIVYYVGRPTLEREMPAGRNWIREVLPNGAFTEPESVPLQQPISSFYTANTRAGCRPSSCLDILGVAGTTVRYARLRLEK